MLSVLKRTVAMRGFFSVPNYRVNDEQKNIYNFKLKNCVYMQYIGMIHLPEHV